MLGDEMTEEPSNRSRDREPVKRLYLIAGANGSGKSTIARELLPAGGPPTVFSEPLHALFKEGT
jgi:predicted ATPase